jgi:hypothetical protein
MSDLNKCRGQPYVGGLTFCHVDLMFGGPFVSQPYFYTMSPVMRTSWVRIRNTSYSLKLTNGKESTVNRALGGSTCPG